MTVSGEVGGNPAQGISKTGAGTLLLSSANSYSGGTLVQEGTLIADAPVGSPTGTGAVTVAAAAVLSARGSLDGSLALNALSALRIGDNGSTGTLAVPGFTAQGGAGLSINVGGPVTTGTSDRLDVAGDATLAGTLHVLALGQPALGDSFALITYTNRTGGIRDAGPSCVRGFIPDVGEIAYGPTVLSLHVVLTPARPCRIGQAKRLLPPHGCTPRSRTQPTGPPHSDSPFLWPGEST